MKNSGYSDFWNNDIGVNSFSPNATKKIKYQEWKLTRNFDIGYPVMLKKLYLGSLKVEDLKSIDTDIKKRSDELPKKFVTVNASETLSFDSGSFNIEKTKAKKLKYHRRFININRLNRLKIIDINKLVDSVIGVTKVICC